MNDTPSAPLVHDFAAEPAAVQTPSLPPAPRFEKGGVDADETRHYEERQAAFDADFAYRGRPLEPFSISRQSLFLQHRLAMGAPDLHACVNDLDAFFADACRILWLCSHTPEDWGILRSSPAALQGAIDLWSDKNITSAEVPEVTMLGVRIYSASRKNEHEPAPGPVKGSADLGKTPCPSGKPAT